ncbi:MAG: LacI family transcriptional regulator [Halomonas sp.]|nr:LacI family transcriptional regulator [Halomonas sp.]
MNIRSNRDQGRKVTSAQVAERAGVSKWTVSRAFTPGASISENARQRVMEAAEALGYRPNLLARSLTTRRTQLIGVVVDQFANPHTQAMLNAATLALQQRGQLSILLNISPPVRSGELLDIAERFQVDGLLFLGTVLSEDIVRFATERQHVPLVQLFRTTEVDGVQIVAIQEHAAGAEIARLLLGEGHRRLGYLAGPDSGRSRLPRLDGYRQTLEDHGLALAATLTATDYRHALGYQAMHDYLQRTPAQQRLDALFCENDILAIGALDALHQAGLDGQLAIVGFDDIELAASPRYRLTSYQPNLDAVVDSAITHLLDRRIPGDPTLLPGRLVVRDSHRAAQSLLPQARHDKPR